MRPPGKEQRQYWTKPLPRSRAHDLGARRGTLTLNWVDGALGRISILNPLPIVVIVGFVTASRDRRRGFGKGCALLALVRVVRPPIVGVLVLEHARREAVRGRRQFVTAELGEGGLAPRTDDEHLLLAPFARLARHCRLGTRA